ncbi:hypothetical protein [Streptomyces geranii]|uniref:hypothetical protein n=1 Tax=Streptomyces geranii TaxID=2058923 RepID=UPI000D03C721|nr:hypothetical protein [Streptomyces geranii]
MALRSRSGRGAALLSAATLATGALTGCQTLVDAASDAGCDGTESRVDELKAHGILGSRPQGTVVPKGFEKLDAGCWTDSGEVWLYAERTYVLPGGEGDKAEVTRHYRAAAERAGWQPSRATRGSASADGPTSLCFTLGTKADDTTQLDVYFLTREILDAEESVTGPEFASGTGYRVAVTSGAADGSTAGCPD